MPDLIRLADHRIAGMPPSQFIEFLVFVAVLVFAAVTVIRYLADEKHEQAKADAEDQALEDEHQEWLRRFREQNPTRQPGQP